jgi:hypothetical protein
MAEDLEKTIEGQISDSDFGGAFDDPAGGAEPTGDAGDDKDVKDDAGEQQDEQQPKADDAAADKGATPATDAKPAADAGDKAGKPDDADGISIDAAAAATAIDEEAYAKTAETFWSDLGKKHEDASELVQTREFVEWLGSQPKAMRDKANRFDVQSASEVIDAYKAQAATSATATDGDILSVKFKVGDKERTMAEFAEEYGDDVVQAQIAMANHMVGRELKKVTEQFATESAKLRREVAVLRFWSDVRESHPDAERIHRTPEFRKWLAVQPDTTKSLAKSGRAGDTVSLLDAYKNDAVKNVTATHNDAAAEKRKKEANLHKHTMSGHGATNRGDTGAKADDFDSAFEEAKV